MHRARFVVQRLVVPPHTSCCYRCPICLRGDIGTCDAVITIGIVLRFRGNVLVSEQANVDCAAGFGVRLIGCADDAVFYFTYKVCSGILRCAIEHFPEEKTLAYDIVGKMNKYQERYDGISFVGKDKCHG